MSRFLGRLEMKMSLMDVTQFISIAGKEGKLLVRSGEKSGVIYFKNGQVVSCETSRLCGEEAFYEILLWGTGDFLFAEVTVDKEAEVIPPLPSLLLEAARRQDERAGEERSGSEDVEANELSPIQLAYRKLMEAEKMNDAHVQEVVTAEKKRRGYWIFLVALVLILIFCIWVVLFR